MTERAPSISGLNVYLGSDGSIWAVNPADQRGYELVEVDPSGGGSPPVPASGIQEAPADGQFYGRQNGGWNPAASQNWITEAPLDGRFYARQSGAWNSLQAPWSGCTYPPGCSGDLYARKIMAENIATLQLIGTASTATNWDGSYSFILAYLPPGLAPGTDRFVLVPSSNSSGAPDSISCAWLKPTGELAIAFIFEKGPNPNIAWFDGVEFLLKTN